MGRILIGVSSWADPALVIGGFYPPELKTPQERLYYYARSFPLVEMDSSYHYLPTRRNLSIWLEATPPGFLFDVKAFSLLTGHPTPLKAFPRDMREEVEQISTDDSSIYIHKLPEKIVNKLWDRFITAISPLSTARKLGLIVFQFPPWFHPDRKNYDYIRQCKEKLSLYRMAVEFRTGDWLNDSHRKETLRFLREKELCLVCVDEPQGLKTSIPPVSPVTASFAVVRFHGRNKENWEKRGIPPEKKYNYLYSEKELKEWAAKISIMAEETEAVHIVFKTKPGNLAVKNALQMKELLVP